MGQFCWEFIWRTLIEISQYYEEKSNYRVFSKIPGSIKGKLEKGLAIPSLIWGSSSSVQQLEGTINQPKSFLVV